MSRCGGDGQAKSPTLSRHVWPRLTKFVREGKLVRLDGFRGNDWTMGLGLLEDFLGVPRFGSDAWRHGARDCRGKAKFCAFPHCVGHDSKDQLDQLQGRDRGGRI
jgi:hypothetical protein